MSDVMERFERALRSIADEVAVPPEFERGHPALTDVEVPRGDRRPRVLAVAAAALLTVGVGGVWYITGRDDPAGTPGGQPSVPGAVTPPLATSPVPAAEPVQELVVPEPEQVAILDPSLGAGEFTRRNPIDQWMIGTDPPPRWFVRTNAAGAPIGALQIALWRPTEWERSFDDGTPVEVIDGMELRLMADALRPTVGWETADGVRAISGVGNVSEDEVVAAAQSVAAGDPVAFDGFSEVSAPGETWSTRTYATTGTGTSTSVSVGLSAPVDGARLDARVTAFMMPGDVQPLGDAWLIRLPGDGGATIIADLPGGVQATVHVSFESGISPNAVAGAIRLVDPATVPIDETFSHVEVPDDAVIEGGEVAQGRWLFATWDNGDGTGCTLWAASFGGGSSTCGPGMEGEACLSSIEGRSDEVQWSAIVRGRPQSIVLLVDGAEPFSASAIERSGRYTLATGVLAGSDLPERSQLLVDGEPCATG